MKAVMISIRPEWCRKILSGEKTVEVRRNRPSLKTPFKCYIYCTKGNKESLCNGRVIAEFICDYIYNDFGHCGGQEQLDSDMPGTAMTFQQYDKYCYGYVGYGWHISNLKVYSEPEELEQFEHQVKYHWYDYCGTDKPGWELKLLEKAPQSWCYVEEIE